MTRTVGILAVVALAAVALTGCGSRSAVSPVRGAAVTTNAAAGTTATATAGSGATAAASAPATRSATTTRSAGGANVKTIYLAGGCFWGLEKYVGLVHGVVSTEVGYANGNRDNATYGDGSGYAETVKIEYDPKVAPLPFLLDLYYDAIDPTTVNRQGNDVGAEYRTGIYYTDPDDKAVIEQSLAELQKNYSAPIAIEVAPLDRYNAAEAYHQKYLEKNPGGYCHIPRKLFDAAAAAQAK